MLLLLALENNSRAFAQAPSAGTQTRADSEMLSVARLDIPLTRKRRKHDGRSKLFV